MGVWDRDYSKTGYGREVGGVDWRSRLPPRGALILIVLHLIGFLTVHLVRRSAGEQALVLFVLRGDALHPAAVLLHPFGNLSILTLIFVVYAIWTLGGRIEARFGVGRLMGTYVVGTLIGGIVFLGFAQLSAAHTGYALDLPAGALAAWVLGAWRGLSDEIVSVFGKLMTMAKVVALGAAILAALVFFSGGPGATGWLIAAAAGSLAWPAVSLVSGIRGIRVPADAPRRREAGRPEPRSDLPQPSPEDAAIDDLLAKISREGIDALTPTEREQLEAARRAKLRRSR
jgi:membrane associated rhomboid family serine protease